MAVVLIIESDLSACRLMRRHLEAAGHYVETTGDGASGLAYTITAPPDLVIVSADASNLDGLGIVQALRARAHTARVPVILTSARDRSDSVLASSLVAAKDLLLKPFVPAELLSMVARRSRRRGRGAAVAVSGPKSAGRLEVAPTAEKTRDPREEIIGNYRLVRLLARRDRALVYLARSLSDGTDHVLKVLRLDDPAALQRFEQEYATARLIRHPNVARLHEHGYSATHAWIAMEYLSGGDLRLRIERGAMTPRDCLRTIWQAALGLAAVHERNIVHRDVKPENLMFRTDGTLVITDFGVAKPLDAQLVQTSHGEVFGTPYYMSPEQAVGAAVDVRADLYSLGIVFYELLTGARPFSGANGAAVVYQHAHIQAPALPAERVHFQPVIDRLIAKQPADRYPSVVALLRALRMLDLRHGAPQLMVLQ